MKSFPSNTVLEKTFKSWQYVKHAKNPDSSKGGVLSLTALKFSFSLQI